MSMVINYRVPLKAAIYLDQIIDYQLLNKDFLAWYSLPSECVVSHIEHLQ